MKEISKIDRLEELMMEPLVCEFHALAAEIDAYEREKFPVKLPTIGQAMKFRREQMMETQRQIAHRSGITLGRWKVLEIDYDAPSMREARCLYAIGIPANVILSHNIVIE